MSLADVLSGERSWWIEQADVLDGLRRLPDGCVQCVVTSPPYFALRNYGCEGQIGLESSPGEYLAKMVAIFREIRRVLRSDGTVWVNEGDTFAGSGKGHKADGSHGAGSSDKQLTNKGTLADGIVKVRVPVRDKCLLGMPWRLAFAMVDDGWILRSAITLCKVAPMPESVRDRPTQATEMLFLFTKQGAYYYDQDAERMPVAGHEQRYLTPSRIGSGPYRQNSEFTLTEPGRIGNPDGANLRNWWEWRPEPNKATKTRRYVRVSADAVGGDIERIASPDCPIHVNHQVAMAYDDGPQGDQSSHIQHTETDLVRVQPGEPVPTPDQSSVVSEQASSTGHAATRRSTPSSRTGLHAETNPAYNASSEKQSRTDDTLTRPDGELLRHDRDASNTEAGFVEGEQAPCLSSETLYHNADSEIEDAPLGNAHSSFGQQNELSTGESRIAHVQDDPSEDTEYRSSHKSSCTCSYYKVIVEETAHFAQFPTFIPARCVKLGTSERGCCPACGAPWRRVTERTAMVVRRSGLAEVVGNRTYSSGTMEQAPSSRTIGWQPSCRCPAVDPIGCLVLDPFVGSGTTVMTARRLGRRGIGIELSPEYVAMARQRVSEDQPMLNREPVAAEEPKQLEMMA